MSSEPGWGALVLALWVSLGGCAGLERGEPTPDAGTKGPSPTPGMDGGEGGGSTSFSDVHPLLLSACQSCHRAGGSAGDSGYVLTGDAATDLASARDRVETSNPAASRLLRKAAGLGHGGGTLFPDGSFEYQALRVWIASGAAP